MTRRVDATKTPVTESGLTAAIRKAWEAELGGTHNVNSVALLVAQVELETGLRFCVQWNIGNIKGQPGWGGDWTYYTTWEVVPRSTYEAMVKSNPNTVRCISDTGDSVKVVLIPDNPGCCFRAYASLDEGAADYFRVLRKHFSQSWSFVEAADPFGFCQSLHDHGYYTASPKTYTAAVCRIFDQLASPAFTSPQDITDAIIKWSTISSAPATVCSFQAANGLTVDGVPGPLTRCKLRPFLAAATGHE